MEVIILKYVQLICVTMFFTNNANCDQLNMENSQSDQNLFKIAGCIAKCLENKTMILETCYKVCSDKVSELQDVKRIEAENIITIKLHCRDNSRLVMKLDDTSQFNESNRQRTYLLKIQETKNEYAERFIFITGDSIIEIESLASSTSFNISASVVNSNYEYIYIGNKIFTTLKENYVPEHVTNITFSHYTMNKQNDSLLDVFIHWTPARDATCFYDVLIWAHDSLSHLQEYEIRKYSDLYSYKLEGLTYKTNYSVSVRGIGTTTEADGTIKWMDIETPSCNSFHEDKTVCAPEKLENITTTMKHLYDDLYDIDISWNPPVYIPKYYNIKIIDLETMMNNNNNNSDNTSREFNVSGEAIQAFASKVHLERPHQEITITAISSQGKTTQTYYMDLEKNENENQSKLVIFLVILFVCIAIMFLGGFFVWKNSFYNLQNIKQLQFFELQLKIQSNMIRPAELDLIRNVSLKSLDLLRHMVDDPMEILQDNISIYNEIGVGEFGLVKRGVVTVDGIKKEVAVKMLKSELMRDERCLFEFRREIDMMKSVGKHPNILGIIGHCTAKIEELMLFTEFSDNGNLLDFLRLEWKNLIKEYNGFTPVISDKKFNENVYNFDNKADENTQIQCKDEMNDQPFTTAINKMYFSECVKLEPENYLENLSDSKFLTETDLLSYGKQVAMGMDFLTKKKIIHRDLAARNVLVFGRKCVKISDFGLSRDVYQENVYKKTGNGKLPLKWMALESLTHQVYTTESDVWSFGILMYEIVTLGSSPYPSTPPNDLLKLLKVGYRMEKPVHCSDYMYSFIKSCWCENTIDRPTFQEASSKMDELILNQTEEMHIDLNKIIFDTK